MATGIQVWSQSPASNATADSNINWAEGQAPSSVNDSARSMMASVAKWRNDNNGTILTSGSTLAYTAVTNQIEGSLTAGYTVAVQFHATSDAAATLAVDGLAAKPLQILPGVSPPLGAFSAGTIWNFTYSTTGTGQWLSYNPPSLNTLTGIYGANSVFTTTAYFDGPSVTQGSSGTWLVTGGITVIGQATNSFYCKLWDGTTVLASRFFTLAGANNYGTASLSGAITSPAGNLKISVACNAAATANFAPNADGNGNSCTITAVRIA